MDKALRHGLTKQCVQCTRELPLSSFEAYVSRSKKVKMNERLPNVGKHTVCKDCEQMNASITYIWQAVQDEIPEAVQIIDNELVISAAVPPSFKERVDYLVRLARIYKAFQARGGRPSGRFARALLGIPLGGAVRQGEYTGLAAKTSMFEVMVGDEIITGTMQAYEKLLSLELTEEPQVYQDMLDKLLQESCTADGKVTPTYKTIFEQVAARFDDYEDNYNWA